jgi:hypothetical protein
MPFTASITIQNINALTQPSSPAKLAMMPIMAGPLAFDFSLVVDYFGRDTEISCVLFVFKALVHKCLYWFKCFFPR